MSKQTCPDCKGAKRVETVLGVLSDSSDKITVKIDCKRCKGKGTIKVKGPVAGKSNRGL